MDMSGGQREDSRYDEYTAILAENPVYQHAFEGACEEYLRRNGNLELYGGTVSIYGNVMINGQPYRPCSCG